MLAHRGTIDAGVFIRKIITEADRKTERLKNEMQAEPQHLLTVEQYIYIYIFAFSSCSLSFFVSVFLSNSVTNNKAG